MIRMDTDTAPLTLREAAEALGVETGEMFDLLYFNEIPHVLDSDGLLAVTREALDEYRAGRSI